MDAAGTTVAPAQSMCSDREVILPAAGSYTLVVDTPLTSSHTGTYGLRILDPAG